MIGFISDIHGNFSALCSVLEELDHLNCSTIYSLGDVAGYYPSINECCSELRHRNIINLMGNHDQYIINGTSCGRSRSVDMAIAYQANVIEKENIDWLKGSPQCIHTEHFFACHGGPEDFIDQYLLSPPFPLDEKTGLFLSGHTHKAVIWEKESSVYCNPGAVGQPRDGDPRASFAILNDFGHIEIHRVKYDIDATAKLSKEAGFFPAFYECLYEGVKIH
ncbi:MAG: metallophosphoesterase family protein [Oscillospiraceae bacterium]|nr:metallophosphoesterase family protein [Oscillospiraceae bacterium]